MTIISLTRKKFLLRTMLLFLKVEKTYLKYYVNLSKRVRKDRIFLGLVGLLRGISRGAKPEGNPEEQPCQPEKNPVLPDSFTQIYILFPTRFFKVLRSAGE